VPKNAGKRKPRKERRVREKASLAGSAALCLKEKFLRPPKGDIKGKGEAFIEPPVLGKNKASPRGIKKA